MSDRNKARNIDQWFDYAAEMVWEVCIGILLCFNMFCLPVVATRSHCCCESVDDAAKGQIYELFRATFQT